MLAQLFAGGLAGVLDGARKIVDEFHLSGEEKNQFMLQMEALLQQRDKEIERTIRSELKAKSDIVVAELSQGDNYTKRARPTLIYFGMALIFFNYCLVPLAQTFTGATIAPFELPGEFWLAWGGAVSVYALGRSAEKRGIRNPATSAITGSGAAPVNKLVEKLLD